MTDIAPDLEPCFTLTEEEMLLLHSIAGLEEGIGLDWSRFDAMSLAERASGLEYAERSLLARGLLHRDIHGQPLIHSKLATVLDVYGHPERVLGVLHRSCAGELRERVYFGRGDQWVRLTLSGDYLHSLDPAVSGHPLVEDMLAFSECLALPQIKAPSFEIPEALYTQVRALGDRGRLLDARQLLADGGVSPAVSDLVATLLADDHSISVVMLSTDSGEKIAVRGLTIVHGTSSAWGMSEVAGAEAQRRFLIGPINTAILRSTIRSWLQ